MEDFGARRLVLSSASSKTAYGTAFCLESVPGIELVALWTLISLIFHAVRLAQASAAHDRGEPVVSWLS